MKKLYMIGGAMGVGKTTTCTLLRDMLSNCAFLDGDWCWSMHPFRVTEETKRMVEGNIVYLLNSFLRCSAFENVVFCWVMHEQRIIDDLLSRLEGEFEPVCVSLVCTEQALRARLTKDVDAGLRTEDVIERSAARIPLYEKLNTVKLDVSEISAEAAAKILMNEF